MISRNLFHIQTGFVIIEFSFEKQKSCNYQNCDSHISRRRCQSTLWTLLLSYKHLVSSYQHIQYPNFISILKKSESGSSNFECIMYANYWSPISYGLFKMDHLKLIKLSYDKVGLFQSVPDNTNKRPVTVNMAGQWATRVALACIAPSL